MSNQMRILFVHNYYQVAGGEDQILQAEADLLELHGHQVYRYTVHNDGIKTISPLVLAGKTVWNQKTYRSLRSLVREQEIQVVHCHNTFPLISPSAYYAAQAEQVPVVQTCHNYRLLCPNALFLREGRVCEACLTQFVPWSGVKHACYRGSRAASGAVAAMLTLHRSLGTWTNKVDAYIALTDFARQKLVQGGLPADKIIVKPNFVHPDPGIGSGQGRYALYAGRLSQEKGIATLLEAWRHLGHKIPLKIVGDGPLSSLVSEATQQIPGIMWLGHQPLEQVYRLLQAAAFLVFPSEWYEGQPRILLEAFATGTPVVASNLGSMSSLITSHQTGLHFQPGDIQDLVAQVEWLLNNSDRLSQMRQIARKEFETTYTAAANYDQLINIYAKVRDNRLSTKTGLVVGSTP